MGKADCGPRDHGDARRDRCDDTLPEPGAARRLPLERVSHGVPAPEAREQYTAPPGPRKAIRAYPGGYHARPGGRPPPGSTGHGPWPFADRARVMSDR